MHTSSSVYARLALYLLLLGATFWFPWWVPLVGVLGAYVFAARYECAAVGVLLDALYVADSGVFLNTFRFTTACLLAAWGVWYVRTRMRIHVY